VHCTDTVATPSRLFNMMIGYMDLLGCKTHAVRAAAALALPVFFERGNRGSSGSGGVCSVGGDGGGGGGGSNGGGSNGSSSSSSTRGRLLDLYFQHEPEQGLHSEEDPHGVRARAQKKKARRSKSKARGRGGAKGGNGAKRARRVGGGGGGDSDGDGDGGGGDGMDVDGAISIDDADDDTHEDEDEDRDSEGDVTEADCDFDNEDEGKCGKGGGGGGGAEDDEESYFNRSFDSVLIQQMGTVLEYMGEEQEVYYTVLCYLLDYTIKHNNTATQQHNNDMRIHTLVLLLPFSAPPTSAPHHLRSSHLSSPNLIAPFPRSRPATLPTRIRLETHHDFRRLDPTSSRSAL
jgi:hypothetical protein